MAESQTKSRLQPVAVNPMDRDIDLFDCLLVIWRVRWMLLTLCLVTMVSTVAIVMTRPRYYKSSVTIVPPIEALQKQFGADSFGGALGNPLLRSAISGLTGSIAGIYVEILESRVVADGIIDRFGLMEAYKRVRHRPDARKQLAKKTRIETTEDGAIKIAVLDRDPNQSAAIAIAYVEELDRQNKRLSGGQATGKRVFLENRLKEIEAKFKRFTEISTQETRVQEMLYELLVRECELAKIEEAKNMPTIQVLDPAVVPERPVARGTVTKGVLAGVAASIFGIFMVFTREYVTQARRREGGAGTVQEDGSRSLVSAVDREANTD